MDISFQTQFLERYFEEFFVLQSPDATNVWIAAGLNGNISSVSAAGYSRDQALAGMFGELCEREALDTYEPTTGASDLSKVATIRPFARAGSSQAAPSIDLATGEACLVPLDFLRPDASSGLKQSEGCGAGVNIEAAQLHGIMELIERDALALWWHCGRRGRIIADSAPFVCEVLGEGRDRDTYLLDITSDLMIPTIVAVSFDAQGRMFTSGLAAANTSAKAARSALKELVQMEFGHHLIREKLRRLDFEALGAHERLVLERASRIDRAEFLRSASSGVTTLDELAEAPASALDLARHLSRFSVRTYATDLGAIVAGICVTKIVSPDLIPGNGVAGATRLPEHAAGFEGSCGLAYF